MTDEPPAHLIDWKGNDVDARGRAPRPPTPTPASPRRRRSARRSPPSGRTRRACRSRRSCSAAAARTNVPLVTEAFDWEHGVFLGSIMASETTAAAAGTVGKLRFDPFAMLPFCGYNMGDYFAHWLRDRQGHRRRQAAQALLRQLVPPRRRRPLPVAGLRREQPGAQVGLRAGRRRRPTRSTRRSACCPPPTPRHRRPRHHRPTTSTTLLSIDAAGWQRGHPADPRALRPVRRRPPRAARRRRRPARAPATDDVAPRRARRIHGAKSCYPAGAASPSATAPRGPASSPSAGGTMSASNEAASSSAAR